MEIQNSSMKPLTWTMGAFVLIALLGTLALAPVIGSETKPPSIGATVAQTNPDPGHVVDDGNGGWQLTPVSGDNWANLSFALNNTAVGGTVKLSAGTFTIRRNVFVANFQGTLEGAGKYMTVIVAELFDSNGNTIYTQPTQEEVDNLWLPDKDQIHSARTAVPLFFTESDFKVDSDGNGDPVPTQARSTELTAKDFKIKFDVGPCVYGNSDPTCKSISGKDLNGRLERLFDRPKEPDGSNSGANDFGFPRLMTVMGKNGRWFDTKHYLNQTGSNPLQEWAFGGSTFNTHRNDPIDPNNTSSLFGKKGRPGNIGDVSHVEVTVDNVKFEGLDAAGKPIQRAIGLSVQGAEAIQKFSNKSRSYRRHPSPINSQVTVTRSEFEGFRFGIANFRGAYSAMKSTRKFFNFGDDAGLATLTVRHSVFTNAVRRACACNSPDGAIFTWENNTIENPVGIHIVMNNMKTSGGNDRNWFPLHAERSTLLFRENDVEITRADPGSPSLGGAVEAVEDVPDNTSLDVIFEDNHVTMSGTSRQAVLLKGIVGAAIKDNVVTGSTVTGFLLEGVDGAVIEDNNLCGLTVSDPDAANIILANVTNTVLKDNAGQVVKQDPFDPSNEIGDGEECNGG